MALTNILLVRVNVSFAQKVATLVAVRSLMTFQF